MKKRIEENKDLILALKVAYKFTGTFGSDMSDVVNTVIEKTLKAYGETIKFDADAEELYDQTEGAME